ncbi:MAG: hypothetical protein M3286_07315 [Thermoproteota archaeon]|nr:hypothetical protein [Thermoproteota archaeon]
MPITTSAATFLATCVGRRVQEAAISLLNRSFSETNVQEEQEELMKALRSPHIHNMGSARAASLNVHV